MLEHVGTLVIGLQTVLFADLGRIVGRHLGAVMAAHTFHGDTAAFFYLDRCRVTAGSKKKCLVACKNKFSVIGFLSKALPSAEGFAFSPLLRLSNILLTISAESAWRITPKL